MGELKHIKIFSLKSFVICIFVSEIQRSFVKLYSWHTYQILNHSKWTKNEEDIRLELEKGF
jgi:hypothetical protein